MSVLYFVKPLDVMYWHMYLVGQPTALNATSTAIGLSLFQVGFISLAVRQRGVK